jgi:ArsR family transcriptional regulator
MSAIACCPPLGEPALSDADADGLERVFKSLADRHRVRILNRLLQAGGEAVCVCDFEALLGLKQPTVSYHLKLLLDAGLVQREKRGSFAYFSLVPEAFERVRALLAVPALGYRAVSP